MYLSSHSVLPFIFARFILLVDINLPSVASFGMTFVVYNKTEHPFHSKVGVCYNFMHVSIILRTFFAHLLIIVNFPVPKVWS